MFEEIERQAIVKEVADRISEDRKVLDDLIDDIRRLGLRNSTRRIRSFTLSALAIVSSDAGNHSLRFDPFHHQLIRVVDSDGQTLGIKSIAMTTNLDDLLKSDKGDSTGNPNPVGKLIIDLEKATGKKFSSYSDLCPSIRIQDAEKLESSTGWVISYRDLWEWAVLYERLMYSNFSQSTLFVRDGLLRTKLFGKNYFRIIGDLLAERFKYLREIEKKNIYLVGLAKHSSVIDLYRLALGIENIFPTGHPYYVRVPREMERRAYRFPEFSYGRDRLPRISSGEFTGLCASRNPDTGRLTLLQPQGSAENSGTEDSKFVFGSLYLVRFGEQSAMPTWAVDIFDDQIQDAEKIIGHLHADSVDGFPVPCYPQSIQRAHEAAKLTDMDAEILNEAVMDGIREILGETNESLIDRLKLAGDVSGRRY